MILQTTNLAERNKKKQMLFVFFLGWLGLFVFAIIYSLILPIFMRLFLSENEISNFIANPQFLNWINFLTYLSIFIISFITLFPYIRATLGKVFQSGTWVLGFGFTFAILLSSYALNSLYQVLNIQLENNQNQATIVQLVKDAPIISLITFGLLGPIVEEWTYRYGLFQYLRTKNRWIAYIISLTLFGLIHFDFSNMNMVNELLNLPIYLIAGAWFCFIYDRFGLNVAMSAHIINNVLSVLVILFNPANLGSHLGSMS